MTTSKINEVGAAILMGCGAFILLVGVFGALYAFVIMLLWNALVPDIFHLVTITFWQAWGLFILSALLFKTFTGPSKK